MGRIIDLSKQNPNGSAIWKYPAQNYTDLSTQDILPEINEIAYVFNPQGTSWLPGSIGGTYYPAGFYIFNGSIWQSDRNSIASQLEENTLKKRIRVDQNNAATLLGGVIDSTKEYFVDGEIYCSGFSITVPPTGLRLTGYSFGNSKLICSDSFYTMFVSPVGGSGNLVINDIGIEVTGASSRVYNLTAATGFEAIEINAVNYNNCTSRGLLTQYRQARESGIGMIGGTPEIILDGTWIGGYRITESIALGISNISALFIAGPTFAFGGRFITDINVNFNTSGALFDFSENNVVNDESLMVQGAFITRNGIIDSSDATLYPNIDQSNTKCLWSDNTGFPNTTKYIKAVIQSEVETTLPVINTYYPILGIYVLERSSHFDQPANGQLRLLSGNGVYSIIAEMVLAGNSGDVVDIRVTKSSDNGVTFPTQINHIRRVINNLAGARDVAFFPINFIAEINKNERIRLEVENKTGTSSVTAENDSYVIVKQV